MKLSFYEANFPLIYLYVFIFNKIMTKKLPAILNHL